ncbi:hypothetical protein MYX82_12605 [Acidobacteria bacterium AH-259-D05]|nr:hypothetical protein [Acidobacteria bacterium AH-259-D05]
MNKINYWITNLLLLLILVVLFLHWMYPTARYEFSSDGARVIDKRTGKVVWLGRGEPTTRNGWRRYEAYDVGEAELRRGRGTAFVFDTPRILTPSSKEPPLATSIKEWLETSMLFPGLKE